MTYHVSENTFVGTPFHPRTAPLNQRQRWVAWDRFIVVDVFDDVHTELRAIRESAALIDMSPLAKYLISGPDAEQLVDLIITRDATKIAVNQIYYTPWCNHQGKVVGDGMVCRLDETTYQISGDPTYQWLTQNAHGLNVQIDDISETLAILAVQGPKSGEVINAATGNDWSELAFSRLRKTEIGGVEVNVLRQGFTGEHGYEFWVGADVAPMLWDIIAKAGKPFEIRPAGFYASDVARIEAGLIIIGPDYTGAGIDDARGAVIPVSAEHESSPFELDLGRFIDFSKADFIGKQALLEEQAKGGPPRRLVGLELQWTDIVTLYDKYSMPPEVSPTVRWDPLPVCREGHQVGRATSITWSPTIKKMIGFGCVKREVAEPGTPLSVEWSVEGKREEIRATVVNLPFLKLERV